MFNFEEIEFLERITFDEIGENYCEKIFNNFENLTTLERALLTALVKNSQFELETFFKLGVVDKFGFDKDSKFITEVLRKLK